MAKKRASKKAARKKVVKKKKSSRLAKKKKPTKPKKKPLKKSQARKKVRKPSKDGPAKPKPSKRLSPQQRIQQIDKELLKLVNERSKVTSQFIESLGDPQKGIYDPSADDELWRKLESQNPGPVSSETVRGIFRSILSSARRRVKTQRVAFLGPEFSWSHMAGIERFGESTDLWPVNTIASVFEEVNRGHANYGVVPIENSMDGRIIDTLQMFQKLPLLICGEILLSVHHNLMARCPRSSVTEIYAKPEAISQCRDWLSKNMPQARVYPVTSTLTAAELARDKEGVGAIAGSQAAVEYQLEIIADEIEDNPRSVTRFAIIGDEICEPTDKDRTAILLQTLHKPGKLFDALMTFKKNKINLSWIESFPMRGPEEGYLFFMEFDGHVSDNRTRRVFTDLEKMAIRLNILGSYPVSEIRN